jgi:4-carboxymuconolactone decarboxylase
MHMHRPSSPRLEPIPEVAARARERMATSPVNAVNVSATLAHNPVVSRAVGNCAGAILNDGTVEARQRELAILRMGWNCQAVYEFGQHTLFGRSVGLGDEEIWWVTRPLSEGSWTPSDRAVLQLVDDLYTDDCVSDAAWTEASDHFTPPQVLEFIAAAACYRMVSGLLNSCGVVLDDGVPGWPSPAQIQT